MSAGPDTGSGARRPGITSRPAWHVVAPADEGGRYRQRAPDDAPTAEVAFDEAVDVGQLCHHPVFHSKWGPPEAARVYAAPDESWGMVFVEIHGRAVTCWRICSVRGNWLRGMLFAIARGDA